ncbi:hypothetical protein [Pilimelia terevasa]|uniref:hypothetical protein n=1 Tax=Pilimelia terevasa TaxID=53372 RepID=UPI0016638A93|nr:hypothetical protein [Pilimelia terevasa]
MSRERARRRAAREAAAQAARTTRARRAARRDRRRAVLRRVTPRLPARRRVGRLRRWSPARRAAFAVVGLLAVGLVWTLVDELALRLALTVLLALAAPVVVGARGRRG